MRRPLIGAKGFRSFHWTRGTSSRGSWRLTKKEVEGVWMGRRKREEEEV
jgi:hypothetical protein